MRKVTPYFRICEISKDALQDKKPDNRENFRLHVEIPANTSALVYFPVDDLSKLTENGVPFRIAAKTDAQGAKQ